MTSLVKQSLATRDAGERQSGRPLVPRIQLHDLQLHYVKTRENEGRKEGRHLHDVLLQQYANQCNPHGEWHTGPDDSYFFQRLPYHLAQAERWAELGQLSDRLSLARTEARPNERQPPAGGFGMP